MVPAAAFVGYSDIMSDNERRKQLQESFARIGQKVLARLHEIHPELKGKSLEETVMILKGGHQTQWAYRDDPPPQTPHE
jgi:hypothetical protein